MRLSKLALVTVALAAVAAAAQTSPMQGVRNQLGVGPTATPQGSAAAAPAQSSAKPMASPMSPRMSPKASPKTGASAKPDAAKPAKRAAAPEMARRGGKRDPFVNPVVRAVAGGGGPACDTGKRCLAISEVSLKGIVSAGSGMIAVVENNAHKTYFLRENDPVFNGFVFKITGDSVVFRETTLDTLGQPSTHDVKKTVNAPAV